MTLSYQKTWEVMQGLENSFNRIIALDQMIDDLHEAVENEDQMSIVNITHAMMAYMPVYLSQYEKASQRAWNNTVGEVRKIDNPLSASEQRDIDYEEVVRYYDDHEYMIYDEDTSSSW